MRFSGSAAHYTLWTQRELIERAAAEVAGSDEMKKLGVEAHAVEDSVNDLMRNHAPADRALGRLSRKPEARQRIFDGVVLALAEARDSKGRVSLPRYFGEALAQQCPTG